MTVHRWAATDRSTLGDVLPEALVVLPLGATEQHGPHLPSGADALIAATLSERAVERAAPDCERPLVLAPVLAFGASDHHLPFGATLSLTPATLLAVLSDLLRAMSAAGARRVLLVNGHGGSTGVCHAAAAAAAATHNLTVGHVDYWRLLAPSPQNAGEALNCPVPGHAGEFETSLLLALSPDDVRARGQRALPPTPAEVDGVAVHGAGRWRAIDGWTDHPERATAAAGEAWLEQLTTALALRVGQLARLP